MIPVQQQNPIMIGLPPVLISFTILVFKPIAAMARTMKNLLSSLMGAKTLESIPADAAIVVMTDAAIKYRINIGKICLMLTFFSSEPFPFSLRVLIKASTRVMGMIARVRVSFTVTAVSRVAEPRFHMLSQVEAAAVTEDVSLTEIGRAHV